jgi:hypothetical protein
MLTVELTMMKAGPGRLLQSNTVADGTPLMTSDSALVTLTADSLNTPALRTTKEARRLRTAWAMVLQGGEGITPQVAVSIPVEGLTVTAAEADTRQAQPRIEAHTSAAARQYAPRGGMNTDG